MDVSDASDGSVEIRALHRAVNASAVTVDKQTCVASDVVADSSIGTSAENPIIVCDYNGFKAIATQGLDKHYKLGKDIDAQASWSEGAEDCGAYNGTDIATESPCRGMSQLGDFAGSLDGDGHIIKQLYMHNGGGIFNRIGSNSVIKNVHLRELRVVDTSTSTGSLTGGFVDTSYGADFFMIDSCSVQGKISGNGSVGGLVGGNETAARTVVHNSYADVEVRGRHAGGLTGNIGTTGGWIVSSYARGSVEGNGGIYSLVGGLVGNGGPGTIIHNSYAAVAVSQGTHGGSFAGSLVGTISKSYGVGSVSAGVSGGLLGFAYTSDGTVHLPHTFWDKETTGQTHSDGEDGHPTQTGGLSTAQMQVACAEGVTTGICALGDGFVFTEGAYPKVKKCIGACDTDHPVFGTELVGGQ